MNAKISHTESREHAQIFGTITHTHTQVEGHRQTDTHRNIEGEYVSTPCLYVIAHNNWYAHTHTYSTPRQTI